MTTKQLLLKSWPYWLGLPMAGIAINIGRFWMDERHLISKSAYVASGFMIWTLAVSGPILMQIKCERKRKADGEPK
jgi:hypothetical protein